MINFSEEGPMTIAEIKDWMAHKQTRKLIDLCLVASGFDPRQEEVSKFNRLEDDGYPERIFNTAFNEQPNNGLRIQLKDDEPHLDRNAFVRWISKNSVWSNYPPVCKMVTAWELYRFESKYHDAEPNNKVLATYKMVLMVKAQKDTKNEAEAIRKLLSKEYQHLHGKLHTRATSGKPSKLYTANEIAVYCSKAKKIVDEQ